MIKKYTGKQVRKEIDFRDDPHRGSPFTWNTTGDPCACVQCVRASDEIAESLSMEGTFVKGVFTATETKTLKDWAVDNIEDQVYF